MLQILCLSEINLKDAACEYYKNVIINAFFRLLVAIMTKYYYRQRFDQLTYGHSQG